MDKKNALVDRVSGLSPRIATRYAEAKQLPSPFVEVAFQEGRTARLDMSKSRSAVWADVLNSLQQTGQPAYAEIDPDTNELTDLLCPLTVKVEKLTPSYAGDVEVELIISHGRHVLRCANPDFQQLLTILETAQKQGTIVAVTETADLHEIIDVRILPNPPVPAATGKLPPDRRAYAPVSLQRAQELYDLVNTRCCDPVTAPAPCIPFWYPDDGCWGRAHEMRRLMIEDGTEPDKVWIYGGLSVATYNNPTCSVHWGWHVAPILEIQTGSGTETHVIDPSMFSEPVPQPVWVYAQGDSSATVVHTDSAVFYRTSGGTLYYDNDYSQTQSVLAQYRNQLILRSASASGPPPYTACYTPDVYIRDNLQDQGLQPLVGGGISRSPDINHYRQELADPQTTLGSPSAQARDDLFENIEYGQPNYIYARLQNRGMATGSAEVDIYWMPPSTLPTPSSWNLVGSPSTASVAPGEFKVLGPLAWNSIPAKGHYCFVAVLENPQDPKPDLNQVNDINDFRELIRNNNNVTWKNFDVEDVFVGSYMRFDFQIQGWPRISYVGDLELVLSGLPPGAQVELRILKRLLEGAKLEKLSKNEETKYHARYKATSAASSAVRRMPLRASDNSEATIYISLPENAPDGMYEFAVLQRIDGNEVGRITKRFIVGDHPYVANRRTREAHVANCEWVTKMSGKNKLAYRELELALKHGYNGCRYCLPEHDTDG